MCNHNVFRDKAGLDICLVLLLISNDFQNMTVETLIEALGCYNKDYNVQIIQESSDFRENIKCVAGDGTVDTVYIITE